MLPQMVQADIIMWIDSDCWVQRPEAIGAFLLGTLQNQDVFTICTTIDNEYPRCVDGYIGYQDGYLKLNSDILGEADGKFLYGKAVFCSGVFAADRRSQLWQLWEDKVTELYDKEDGIASQPGLAHMAEQQALNLILHQTRGFLVLPTEYNWMCHASTVKRMDGWVRILPSGRVPYILHLAEFSRRGEYYKQNRLVWEDPATS
jgi:hypothetical protein